jgi:uncharacterized repeat protein (TIGR03803 family)
MIYRCIPRQCVSLGASLNTRQLNQPGPQPIVLPGIACKPHSLACRVGAVLAQSRVLPALAAGLALLFAAPLTAQTFTNLYNFTDGSDGGNPRSALLLSGNTVYGTTEYGGSSGRGTVFAVNTDGSGFTVLHGFTATAGSNSTNSDGANPAAGLVLSGNTLYGTAANGGTFGYGVVFAVNTDGTDFTNLYSFVSSADGAYPSGGLVLSGNTLYGTAMQGGVSGYGTIFAIDTDGTGFTNLHSFVYDTDGAYSSAGLVLSETTLYGTAADGGSSGYGTVFAINTDGSGFTNLHSFPPASGPNSTNGDGASPVAGLIVSGNALYGTAFEGGNSGYGTIFAVNTDGSGFTALHSFSGSDGANPYAALTLSGNTLYGTADSFDSANDGTVFKLTTGGADFTILHSFAGADGGDPSGALIISGNTLYGTTLFGGSSDFGTVFSVVVPLVTAPQLALAPAGPNIILTWPTSAPGFTLQSTTSLVPPAVWMPVSPAPTIIDGQFTVTNSASAAQQFYRLSQ